MAYSTIIKPSDYFDTKLYTGNASTNAITGVGFQPDMTWLKQRNGTPDHYLFDAVRGVLNYLTPNLDTQQQANAVSLTAFNSDGFTLGSNGQINASSSSNVSWNWKANGLGSANSDGTITSTYTSANATSKCSIVKWTGSGANATIGHGLGVVPTSIWVKNLTTSEPWIVYNKSLGATHYLSLNTTAGDNSGGEVMWNDTVPTSSVFSIGSSAAVNGSGNSIIAYCFADVSGYSKVSKYTGNGNADGTFIYTGFKPAWIMIKRTDAAGDNWLMFDNKRQGYNGGSAATEGNLNLTADQNAAEGNSSLINIVSNGFKMITSDTKINGNGNLYAYWAFAETPFVSNVGESLPTTAR